MAITWKKVLVFLIVCGGLYAVFFVPEVNQKVKGLFHKAVDEMDVKQESAPEMYGAAKVYVTRGGDKYYHTKDCPTLKGIIAMPRPLSEVKEMYSPCPQCNPPQ